MPVIEVQGRTCDFGSIRALAGVSYTMDEGQVTGLLYLSFGVTLLVGLVLLLIDAALISFGLRTFARSSLLARL